MKRTCLLAGAVAATAFGWSPANAVVQATQPDVPTAEAAVQQRRNELRDAERTAEAARVAAAEAARLRVEETERAAAEARARLAATQQRTNGENCPQPGTAMTAEQREQDGQCRFGGIELGAGLSFTLDLGRNDRVARAEVVNGIVRVTDLDNGRARVLFEGHYFLKPDHAFLGFSSVPAGDWGFGPFIAIQPGANDAIGAFGGGFMIGFRTNETQSFNIGVGVIFDPDTQILGEGIVANEPLPAGETQIRYQETTQTGVMIIASFGF
jgi:hypothetical protein